MAELLELPATQGLLVAQVTRGGPAATAGIQPGRRVVVIGNQEFVIGGDLIVELDGKQIITPADLSRSVIQKKPGDVIRITLYRGNRRTTVEVTLGERPDVD